MVVGGPQKWKMNNTFLSIAQGNESAGGKERSSKG